MATTREISLNREREIQEMISRTPDEAQQIDEMARIRSISRPGAWEPSFAHPIVQEYLEGKAEVGETVEKITRRFDAAMIKSGGNWEGDEVNDLWLSVIHSARRIPFRNVEGHEQLIELIAAYKKHPMPIPEGYQGVYSELMYLGINSREALDSPGFTVGFSIPEVHAYTNLHFFFALMTKLDVREYWIYCIWTMRDALEDRLRDDRSSQIGRDIQGTAAQKYDGLVPAAAMWVFALGKTLYEKEEDRTPKNPEIE